MSKSTSVKIDWLTFSDKFHDISELYEEWYARFGDFISFAGRHGYHDRFSARGCDLLFNGSTPAMGCCVDINGTGTNLLYDQGFKLDDYIRSTIVMQPYYNVSRLDVCLDYFADCEEDMFPFDKLIDCVNNLRFVSKVHKNGRSVYIVSAPTAISTYGGQPYATVYIGSPGSETRLRIYNKLGEQMSKSRGDSPIVPDVFDGREVKQWIRFEFQLRDVSASAFCGLIIDHALDEVFTGYLARFIRFVEHTDLANVSALPVCEWWTKFLGDVHLFIISRTLKPTTLQSLVKYVKQARGAIFTFKKIFGDDYLVQLLDEGAKELNKKYVVILNSLGVKIHDSSGSDSG